jgi:alanine-glyoxylate transaminase/serine-glyoxylate transaminase/serine-pyruvate transaminase
MGKPTIGYLDPVFVEMMEELKESLRYAFQTHNALTFPVSGPGSVGMEMCFVNMIDPGDKVIVCRNGVFGGRMIENVQRCGGIAVVVDDRWGTAGGSAKGRGRAQGQRGRQDPCLRPRRDLDRRAIRCQGPRLAGPQARRAHHHGRGHLARRHAGPHRRVGHRRRVLREPEVPVLHAGLSPISFSDRVVEMVKHRKEKVHSWFLDMNLLLGYWGTTNRTYHHTAPTNSLYALHEALLMLREEGLENAWARHQRNHKALKAGLQTLGMSFLVEEPHRLPQMNAVTVLPGVDEKEVRRRLLLDYNLEIGAGLGDLTGKIWRFGIMGYSCKMENVMLSLCALETVFADLGIKVEFGAAEAAAYHAYAALPNRVQSVRAVAA